MKTRLIGMLLGSLLFFVSAYGQQVPEIEPLFIRVYNEEGVKIFKGKLLSINEEGLVLQRGKKKYTIATKDIASIKTKRSPGHAVGIGATFGLVAGVATGASNLSSTFEIHGQKSLLLKFKEAVRNGYY